MNNNISICKQLLSGTEIDVNISRLNDAITPLMMAIICNRYEIIKLLLKHPKCDIFLECKHRFTAFSYAAMMGNSNIVVEIYLHLKKTESNEKIVDSYINNSNNIPSHMTPLQLAQNGRHFQTMDVLINVCHATPRQSVNTTQINETYVESCQ